MRFRPADRVIDLLVGEDLYSTADAAVRELLQNARDACFLYQLNAQDDRYTPRITVRYSEKDNWLEVDDNGIGMDEETLEKSFVAIGAAKADVSHIREILERSGTGAEQIAKFGIGILSCFGIAKRIELSTKMQDAAGLAFIIPDYHADFIPQDMLPDTRGTKIRLILKASAGMAAADVPAAVRKYARHAKHVTLENSDTGEAEAVESPFLGSDLDGAVAISDEAVLGGTLALHPEWGMANHLAPRLMLCTGGFLVSDDVRDLLPAAAVGYMGELDIRPGSLRILMTREQFKKDHAWNSLSHRLTDPYRNVISQFAASTQAEVDAGSGEETAEPLARRSLVLLRGAAKALLTDELRQQLGSLLPHVIYLSSPGESQRRPLATYLSELKERNRKLYFVRAERERHRVQERIDADGATLQFTETIMLSLRVSLLKAKGETVITCKFRRYAESTATGNVMVDVHEADVVTAAASAEGIPTTAVEQATVEELALDWAPESEFLGAVLDLGDQLKVAHLPQSRDRVVRDYTGRILNSAHEEVRRVLASLPNAIGNPIRRTLVQVYMDLSNHQVADARRRVLELLTLDDLEEQATLRGGEFQTAYLRMKVAEMLRNPRDER